MKKTLSFILGTILILTGCNNFQSEKSETNASTINFSISLSGGEPVTYAPGLHEADEYNITRLDVFEFDKESKLAKVYQNVGMTPSTTPTSKNVKITLDDGVTGRRTFIFLANLDGKMKEDLLSMPVSSTTLADFKLKQTKDATGNLEVPFLMTGEKSVDIPTNRFGIALYLTGEVVTLTRNVARLDIGISLKNASEVLTIKSIKFTKLPKTAYLFQKSDKYAPTEVFPVIDLNEYNETSLVSHFEDIATPNYISRYKKLYYFYEVSSSQYSSNGTPTVEIKAEYKKNANSDPVKMRYIIPFDRSIQRNYLYTITLGVKPDFEETYKPVFNINVLKWEEDAVPVTLDPIIKLESGATTNGKFTFDPASHVVNMSSSAEETLDDAFTVTSNYTGDDNILVVKTSDPASIVKNPNNDWITITPSAGKLKLYVKANDTGLERGGIVWLQSKKNSNDSYKLIIKQPAAGAPAPQPVNP